MKSIGQILEKYDPIVDKYVSREFQSYGLELSEKLGDSAHKSLYIKLSKTVHRSILEQALSFVADSNATSKARLFMWKIKQIRDENPVSKTKVITPKKEKIVKAKKIKKSEENQLEMF